MSVIVRSAGGRGTASLIEEAFSDQQFRVNKTYVAVGDEITIDDQDGFLRGHGTYVVDGKLVATLCGVVERVNMLVYVRPLKSRYTAEQGDVVIGRVSEIAGKRWKVDLNSRQEAGLLLSAVNLPGGIQRRRNAEDELNMRSLFKEGDVISAEVQQVNADGSVALHTRSNKYGKQVAGQVLSVPASLIKRQKQHFASIPAIGVDVILGCNGLIWVAPSQSVSSADSNTQDRDGAEVDPTGAVRCKTITRQQLEAATRVCNCIRALAALYLPIYPAAIIDAYEAAVEQAMSLKDILADDFLVQLIKREALKRWATDHE